MSVAKREGSHLIKKATGKSLAGQWEVVKDRPPPTAPLSYPPLSFFYDGTSPRVKVESDFS